MPRTYSNTITIPITITWTKSLTINGADNYNVKITRINTDSHNDNYTDNKNANDNDNHNDNVNV